MFKKDDAVSPVIGVILMVAITVILAAVIAAFVFGMAGGVDKTKVVSVVVERVNETYVKATNFGGQDASSLDADDPFTFTVNGTLDSDPDLGATVGSIAYVEAGRFSDIAITGKFADGSSSVVYSGRL